MPELTIEFEVECALCGATLDAEIDTKYGTEFVKVDPCESCIDSAKEEGDVEGYDRGHADGHAEGLKEGSDSDDEG